MLDLNYITNNVENIKKRFLDRGFLWDEITFLKMAERKKQLQQFLENVRNESNRCAESIGKNKADITLVNELKLKGEAFKIQQKEVEKDFSVVEQELKNLILHLPNLPQENVPVGKDEKDNKEILCWGIPKHEAWHKEHDQIGEKLGMNAVLGAKLSGSRFTVLRKNMARLHRALAQFMLEEHISRGYEEVYVPYMVKAEAMQGTGQLPKFAEDMFYIEKDQMYLIPTAEVPLTNLLAGELLDITDLPLNFVAHTPCFRREVGAAGRDTKGMIRQHQFDKVELVKFVKPEDSEREFFNLLQDAKNILEKLELPYREVLLCTKDMGFGSSKTHDLEVWLPGQNAYREISSVTNFETFQARRMGLRFKDQKKKVIPHTINGSGLAVGRTLVAVIENYQQPNGSIVVPKALQHWMNGIQIIN